jgi:hypothetical protein
LLELRVLGLNPIHDWLELVLVNHPTINPGDGIYPKKIEFIFLGHFAFHDID